jgi:hypothetical protein
MSALVAIPRNPVSAWPHLCTSQIDFVLLPRIAARKLSATPFRSVEERIEWLRSLICRVPGIESVALRADGCCSTPVRTIEPGATTGGIVDAPGLPAGSSSNGTTNRMRGSGSSSGHLSLAVAPSLSYIVVRHFHL